MSVEGERPRFIVSSDSVDTPDRWRSNLYSETELREAFGSASFSRARFASFPVAGQHLSLWRYIVDAAR